MALSSESSRRKQCNLARQVITQPGEFTTLQRCSVTHRRSCPTLHIDSARSRYVAVLLANRVIALSSASFQLPFSTHHEAPCVSV